MSPLSSLINGIIFIPHVVGFRFMSDDSVWDAADKRDIGTLRERFKILERSTYANPRMNMLDDSVGMVAERAPPLIGAIIAIATGILVPLFIVSVEPMEGPILIFMIVVPLAFCGGGLFLLSRHFRGDKWLFIHENHLELRHEKSEKGIPEAYKHIPLSDVVKIISHERISESTDEDGSAQISVSQVTSILVYNPDEPESRKNQELCQCVTDIRSRTREESDAIAAALNLLILGTPLPSQSSSYTPSSLSEESNNTVRNVLIAIPLVALIAFVAVFMT